MHYVGQFVKQNISHPSRALSLSRIPYVAIRFSPYHYSLSLLVSHSRRFLMSEEVRDFFHHSYDNVNDREKLRHIIKDIQAAGQSALKENASIQNQARARETELREQVDGLRKDVRARDKKLQSVGYSTRASHEPRWTQAEKDYPSDDAKVVFFDGRVFKVKSAKELQG